MAVHLYLSVFPESLVASMLPAEEFGTYLAVGTQKRSRGPAVYFQITRPLPPGSFDLSQLESRCVPHPDGEPKHSVYLAVYRVLERVPLEAIGDLFLATGDGRVLRRSAESNLPAFPRRYYLYQELGPVYPRVASTLDPREFVAFITDRERPIHVPKVFFADLRLGELAENPETGNIRDLPYTRVEHLRDCLRQLRQASAKQTKTVDRMPPLDFPFRTVESGFYLGDGRELRFYPFPRSEELQTRFYEWWRSASL